VEGFGYEGIRETGRADDPVLHDGGAVAGTLLDVTLGVMVGFEDGKMVFTMVGKIDRMYVGITLGAEVGDRTLGKALGTETSFGMDGMHVGDEVGVAPVTAVGSVEGSFLGVMVGLTIAGALGANEGLL